MKNSLTALFREFIQSEQASGIILIVCTITAMVLSNSSLGKGFLDIWHLKIGLTFGPLAIKFSILHWINEGLMTIFFLLIGLEIERELYVGELKDIKNASLPIAAAIGGMTVPASIYLLFNLGTEAQRGFGIPTATDIAFVLGVLAILSDRVPPSLKIFLAALAIMDDLGAIVIIALFYAGHFSFFYLGTALGIFLGLLIMNRLGVRRLVYYIIPGIILWVFMLRSGVHATLSGVLIAFAIPFKSGKEDSPSYRLQRFLHKPVSFIIMPLFALANTDIIFSGGWLEGLGQANSLGIIAGLFIGKPFGIVLFSLLATKWRISQWPKEVSFKQIIGAGFLGGIGFTMSIFITLLAFPNPEIVQSSKIAILLSSLMAGTAGYLILCSSANRRKGRQVKIPPRRIPPPVSIDRVGKEPG
jgi:Na+:H+ antiporter, NhaA family